MKSSTPKEAKNDLVTCPFCDVTFSKKHASKHKQYCNNGATKNFDVVPSKFAHPFVKDRVLYANVEDAHLPVELNSLNSWIKENLVQIHPDIMKVCEMKVGDAISICSSDSTFISIVWPSTKVQLGFVGVPKSSHQFRSISQQQNAKLIRVERVPSVKLADSVEFKSKVKKTFTQTPEFLQYCRLYMNGAFLSEVFEFKIPYYGQICEFSCSNFVSREEVDYISTEFEQKLNLKGDEGEMNGNSTMNDSLLNETSFNESTDSLDVSLIVLPRTVKKVNNVFRISDKTQLKIENELDEASTVDENVKFDDFGGLFRVKELLDEHIVRPFKFFKSNSNSSRKNYKTRSLLLYGPSGCGKTKIGRALANEANLQLKVFDTSMTSEWDLTKTSFKECLIFFDDIDAKVASNDESSKKTLNDVCLLLDSLENFELTFFVAATSKPERLDVSLRRRFDVEIEFSVPNAKERQETLKKIVDKKFEHHLTDENVEKIADLAHGFTSSDLQLLCKEAASKSINRLIGNVGDGLVEYEDFVGALGVVRPSGMREIYLEVPKVFWMDIGGQQHLKLQLKQAIEWPLKRPESFARLGIKPPSGVLMYGPPGCSKTMVAKALATESGLNFLAIKGPELFSKWVGESERAVREVFRKARQVAPSIVFFDEIDALAGERTSAGSSNVADRVLTQLLTELDGVQVLNNVIVVAATNRPDVIDRALLRPGRLDRMVYVPLPDAETRKEIFAIQFRKIPVASDVDADVLVQRTEGYSGAELVIICTEAAMLAMQESLDATLVRKEHFEQSLHLVKPRTDQKTLKVYEDFAQASSN